MRSFVQGKTQVESSATNERLYSSLEDLTLIQLVARQDQDALSELYDRFHRLVFSIAYHVVGNEAVAEEITLDVFSAVWDKAETYQSARGQVSTWLTRIARNRAIDLLRYEGSRPAQQSLDWVEPDEMVAEISTNPEPATHLLMEQQRVRRAMQELSAEQREVIAMAYFQGYTQQKIADITGLPLGTVKTRVRLAMEKLRELLIEH